MPTPKIFQQINRDIIMRWPYSECNQIDTYVRNDDRSKFNLPNLGMSYNDYLGGYFWSRYWVGQGADPNALAFKYPVMAEQSLYSRGDNTMNEAGGRKVYTQHGTIVFVEEYDCKDCNRTQWQVSDDTKAMLLAYIELIFSYGEWEVTDAEGIYRIWTTQSVIDRMIADGEILAADCRSDLEQSLRFSPELVEWEYDPAANVIGWMVNYELTYCYQNEIALSTSIEEYGVIGGVRCDDC